MVEDSTQKLLISMKIAMVSRSQHVNIAISLLFFQQSAKVRIVRTGLPFAKLMHQIVLNNNYWIGLVTIVSKLQSPQLLLILMLTLL